ncbi:transcription repressor OFP15 [Neltuma alba]|uniref:transcription repressor OFP15 n=1 Tax=Neltuma alba TaxID=207710 RepID=UPI0010A50A0C|nr:transcription repressor OFP15-like [Prosopis alba]
MGKKMKLIPFLLKTLEPRSSSSSWSWPSCHHPRTLSFRASSSDFFKTINSAYLDLPDDDAPDPIEAMIRGGLRSSDRLFFEPDPTSSILEAKSATTSTYKDTLVLSMESQDPFVDFRKSMEEMVEAHEVKDWDSLEELLCWYLRVNAKSNHGYIMGAFVDLLLALSLSSESSSPSSASSHSPSSPLSLYTSSSPSSSFTTPCASCLEVEEDVRAKQEIKHEDEASSSSAV